MTLYDKIQRTYKSVLWLKHQLRLLKGSGTTLDGKANIVHSHAVSDVTGLQAALDGKVNKDVVSALPYASSVALDFNSDNVRTINLTGDLSFATTQNKAAGKSMVVRLICDSTSRTLAFPIDWVFLGDISPSSIAAGKTGILSLYCFGTNETDVIASYSVQP